jgi:hypothetical protein
MPSYRFDRGDWTIIVENHIAVLYFLYNENAKNLEYWSMTVTGDENKNCLMDQLVAAYEYFESQEVMYGL